MSYGPTDTDPLAMPPISREATLENAIAAKREDDKRAILAETAKVKADKERSVCNGCKHEYHRVDIHGNVLWTCRVDPRGSFFGEKQIIELCTAREAKSE